jgi:DNA replication protein DnaC
LNTLYLRTTKLFEDLALAKGDGRYLKLLKAFAKADLLVLDDYGLVQLGCEQRHEQIGDPTVADAILDRLVHTAHTIQLKGESMRKKKASLT